MSSSALIRWGKLAAMLGGVVWLADNLLFLAFPQAAWSNAVVIVATLLVLATGRLPRPTRKALRAHRTSFWTVAIASMAWILSLTVFLAGSNALIWLAYPVAPSGILVGFVFYETAHPPGAGVATLVRGGAHHRLSRLVPLREILGRAVWDRLAGAGVRALVAEGPSGRAALSRELGKRSMLEA